ncbi:MAG: pentapeptide MXKDX repeat protein [Alphaproteobacteria bacterium]
MSITRILAAAGIASIAFTGAALAQGTSKDAAMSAKDQMMKEEAMKKDAMKHDDGMKKDEMKKDAMMKKDEMKKDAMKK